MGLYNTNTINKRQVNNRKTLTKTKQNRKSNLELLLLTLPAAAVTFIFAYMPLPGIILAFKKFDPLKGVFNSDWVGFTNFKFLFQTGDAYRITRNAIFMNILFIIFGTIAAVAVSLLLFELTKKFLIKLK